MQRRATRYRILYIQNTCTDTRSQLDLLGVPTAVVPRARLAHMLS